MKKIIALLLALTMVFALAACGGKEDPSNNNQNTSETQNTSNGAQENEDNTSAETNENDEKEFNSLGEEVESWFRYAKDECDEDWAVVYFDGYDLVQTDPQGYDKYYIMVCPVDDYDTYEDAGAVDLTYGVYDSEGRPYRFGIEHWNVEKGKYTIVFAQMGGDVEIQFDAEKISDTEWKFDFENAKCPALDSKYAGNSSTSQTNEPAGEHSGTSVDSAVLKLCGLTLNDIITSTGKSAGDIVETADVFTAPVYCEDTSFDSFEAWLGALAENCRKASTDGKLYEDEFTWTEINDFELDSNAVNVILFIYKTTGHSVYVTASNDGSVEGAFSCKIQVY